MKFLILVAAVLATVLSDTPTVCPKGYTQIDLHCFKFLRESLNFFEATVACNVIDGKLVQVTNEEDQRIVSGFLNTAGSPSVMAVWMGATDLQTEGVWEALSSQFTGILATWGHWAPSYPHTDTSRNCAIMNMASYWAWQDEVCTKQHQVLCEVRLRSPDDVIG